MALEDKMKNVKLNAEENDGKYSGVEDKEEKELICHAQMIGFFAHKGGVSKTTTVHHLGYMLAKTFHYKVLMIDADPQKNLTQTCCPSAKMNAEWRDDVDRGTIFTAVERLHYGMKDGEYIDPAQCVLLYKNGKRYNDDTDSNDDIQNEEDEDENEKKSNNSTENNGELWLLPGSLDLAKLEPQITFAHNITNPAVFPLFDDIAGAFRHLFISTCATYDIDFCLIDMGPSIGELNKSLFWSSDYFCIPCAPDSYCKTTIKTMISTLPVWSQQQRRLSAVTKEMTMYLNPVPPKFLGLIFGLFQTSGKNKKAIKDSLHWMNIIKNLVSNELIPTLQKCDMYNSQTKNYNFTLAEIPHFLSLMPIAQRSFSPVFDIPLKGFSIQDDDGNLIAMNKSEISRHKERSKYFFNKFKNFALNIVNALDIDENEEENEDDDDDDTEFDEPINNDEI